MFKYEVEYILDTLKLLLESYWLFLDRTPRQDTLH